MSPSICGLVVLFQCVVESVHSMDLTISKWPFWMSPSACGNVVLFQCVVELVHFLNNSFG